MKQQLKKACLSVSLAVIMLAAAWIGLVQWSETEKAVALDASSKVEYPFATGKDAFKYAPTVTGPTEQSTADSWVFLEVVFDPDVSVGVDFSAADYIAIQMRMDKGSPGFSAGLCASTGNGRYCTNGKDGQKAYFQQEKDGAISEMSILYDSLSFPANACGTLYIPLSSMQWRADFQMGDLKKIKSFFFETNAKYNWNYEITFGEIAAVKGEPDSADAEFTKIVDLSNGERNKGKYYMNGASIVFPSDSALPRIPYAFRSAATAFENTVTWKPTAKSQTLTVQFDDPAVDLSGASHVLVQYYSKNNQRLQWALSDGEKTRALKNGSRTFFIAQGANMGNLTNNANANGIVVNNGRYLMGMVVLPIAESMTGDADLANVSSLVLTADAPTEVVIGEVAYYTADRGDGSYEGGVTQKILDLSQSKGAKFTASVAQTLVENQGPPAREKNGEVTMDFDCANKSAEDFSIWEGGSKGKVEMTTDSYGKPAVQLQATENNPTGDAYTAITLSSETFSWAGMKGVAFWARNDSDTEVSFNIEVDCKTPALVNGYKQVVSDRFNIQQGHRFYLYDINTGKTTIYMTRPTATLTVGFEGWVFVPFSAFERASWSANGVTKNQFMDENSVVTYLAVTVHAATYAEKAFALNQFGAYATVPSFESAYVKPDANSIPALLGLIDQED